jgi:hypothetical protein
VSNKRKARSHPGHDKVTVACIAEEAWQAAGSPADTEGWLGTLSYGEVDQVMVKTEVARDELLRRLAGFPDLVRQASTAERPFVMLVDLAALRQWWKSASG